jgi:hypothetical protein
MVIKQPKISQKIDNTTLIQRGREISPLSYSGSDPSNTKLPKSNSRPPIQCSLLNDGIYPMEKYAIDAFLTNRMVC